MENFYFNWNTRMHFGKDVLRQLPEEIRRHGSRIFFLYGNAAKNMGIYDAVLRMCEEQGIVVTDFTGIEPNPRHSTVDRAVRLLREQGADCIVAAGGGSLMDSAKAISFSVFHEESCWDYYEGKATAEKALPIITIPTLAGSGAEVSNVSVISNHEKNMKSHYRNDLMRPAAAFVDPCYTFSASAFQTAAGVIDIMSHSFEGYFSLSTGTLQDGLSEAIQKTCTIHGPVAVREPENYEARAQLFWAADISITHLADMGRNFIGTVHALESALSGYLNLTHGAGIAILSLAWFKFSLNENTVSRYAAWGRNVWGITRNITEREMAGEAIYRYEQFIEKLGLPVRLSELKGEFDKNILNRAAADLFREQDTARWFRPLGTEEEVLALLESAY